MPQVSVLGIDTAKQLFHIVGMDSTGSIVWRKRLTRGALMLFIAQLPPVGVVNLLHGLSSSRLVCHTHGMNPPSSNSYEHRRFPAEIISHGVWLYFHFYLSYRDVEELLFVLGVIMTYEAIRKWCLKFGQSRQSFDLGVTSSPLPNTVTRCGNDSRCGGRSRARSWPHKGRVRCNPPTSLPEDGINANKLTKPVHGWAITSTVEARPRTQRRARPRVSGSSAAKLSSRTTRAAFWRSARAM